MKRLARALEVLAWTVFFGFAAALLGLRYWVLPEVERYREDIVARVAATVGQPVKIGRIEAAWLGLRPQINLADVRIYDAEGREALVLPSVENILSWRSLAYRELRLHSLVIDGPRLSVRRDASGALYVAGIKLAQGGGNGGFSDWLLAQGEIEIRNAEIEWRDEKRGAPPLALSAVNLRLRSDAEHHSLGLSARLPAALGANLELRAELAGRSVMASEAWSGRVYAELGTTDLAAWRAWVDYPVNLVQGRGALRVWTTLENGVVRHATADLAAFDVLALLGDDLAPLELESLRGRLQARALKDGYQLTGRQLALNAANGPAMPSADFQLSWRDGGGAVTANVVELQPLVQLADALPLPAELRKLVDQLAPRGQLADVRFEWQGPIAAPQRFQARARFAELGLRPWGKLPGFSGFAGTLEASESKGRVYLQSRNAGIDLPNLFPEPRVAFDSLSGQIDWQQEGERFSARLTSISFSNEHLTGSAFGGFTRSGPGPGAIDLSATLARADGHNVARYLPLGRIMGQKTRDWLAKGILAGQASDVHLRLRGNLADFPYSDPAKGQFLASARIRNGVLDYGEGWPRIYDIDGELHFERERMDIVGRSGSILGAKLEKVRVSIPNLGTPAPQLLVTGEAEGPTAEFLKYIESSPVRRMTAGFTEGMSASGRGRLRLKLDLPLANPGAAKVAGDYQFADNSVVLHRQLPPLEHAGGKLAFTEASFTAYDVRGRAFGGPVAISGGTRPAGGMEFVARGDATVTGAAPLLERWRGYLSGGAAYTASVGLRDGAARVVVESSLRGLASSLPAPLEKSAAEALPLRIEVVTSEPARDRVLVSLGKVLAAEALRAKQGDALQVERAALWLSPAAGQALRVPRAGTFVYGSLPAFDFDRWRALLGGGEADAPAATFDVKLASLQAYGKRFNDVALRASSTTRGWSAMVSAREIEGDLSYRAEGSGQLIARLAHFDVPADGPGAKPESAPRPTELPAMDLIAERFSIGGKALGRVELAASRDGEDWRIEKLTMANADATLRANALWRGGAVSRSVLDFSLEARDAGKFLGRVGYPGLVAGGKARLDGSVSWQGEPLALDIPSLSGELKMSAEDGQFLEIEPGIGKLISLMSLQALPRRIALDFRDVFSKGFRFDRIEAASQIERGRMQIRDFRMRGPAAEVQMSGEADLAQETQDLRVRVVPGLGDSASTVIGIVNPVAGVTAAIAQRVLKNPLGQIFAHDFSVTGPWSDPKVTKLSVASPPPSETASP